MDYEKIKELITMMEGSSLTELEIEEDDFSLRLSKQVEGPEVVHMAPPMMDMPGMMGAAPAAAAMPEAAQEAKADSAEETDEAYITSPIVGVFYSAPAPDAPAFVRVGDRVRKGETVCILEAMKLMNEIPADWDCEIESVLVSNEQKVEYGQPLFRVKKI